ncbi:hypothetical protein Mucpa_0344 [Mucilaginibacter paludis DSM 18603]|uniref:Uncharacterized protein n=1 Tax=Mucilaginibacter paludis DSM 18603 TaxID=714943 RepID=H1YH38_9SPHI|nr:hypothetical protein Mucpa_0344 [Mucilaginibacter paludis DSM 18603]
MHHVRCTYYQCAYLLRRSVFLNYNIGPLKRRGRKPHPTLPGREGLKSLPYRGRLCTLVCFLVCMSATRFRGGFGLPDPSARRPNPARRAVGAFARFFLWVDKITKFQTSPLFSRLAGLVTYNEMLAINILSYPTRNTNQRHKVP